MANLEQEFSRSWGLALLSLWYEVQAGCPQMKGLKPPRFFAGMPGTDTLAQWRGEYRVIEVSARLLLSFDWDNIEGVIKHEIAHQIVDELFDMGDAPTHGEAFRRACKMIGVRSEATWRPMPQAETEEPALLRIRKLLALAESDNANEAAAALAKARALAARHDVDLMSQQAGAGDQPVSLRPIGQSWKRVPGWYWFVMAIVEHCAFVRYVCRAVPADGGVVRSMEIYGTSEHLELAEYVHDFLLRQGERLWRRRLVSDAGIHARVRGSYMKGLYAGVLERLVAEGDDQDDDAVRQAGLVALDDPRLEALFKRRNPTVKSSRKRIYGRKSAMDKGASDSDRLQIRPGLRAGDHPKQLGN